jgi:putative heme-binding domain-containing protein
MRIGPSHLRSIRIPCFTALLALLGVLPCSLAAELPEQRLPWVTSRILGSPDAPSPYRAERTFANLQFRNPVEMVPLPGTNLWFLVEQRGPIFSFPKDGPTTSTNLVIDLKRDLPEFRETYGLAFHPQFAQNRKVYLCYITKPDADDCTHVSEFTLPDKQPLRIDPKSERIIITWRSGGHNGGSLKFGPDGMLYISAGDSGPASPPDPIRTGQNLGDLMSAISRIDVDHPANGKLYSIPTDNPFLNTPGARPELWCYGLRNPWRMSFDATTGALWVGDVGWEIWELVYKIQRGANYGWSVMEGPQLIHPTDPLGPTPVTAPTYAHSHSEARSITGGFVYRGKKHPALVGKYIHGDWVTGKVWSLREVKNGKPEVQEIANTALPIICFGEDHNRELYIVSYDGGIYELQPNKTTVISGNFPKKLSDTGLFHSTARHQLAEGVLPYEINTEMWSDGAIAERFIALPGSSTIGKFTKGDFSKGETKDAWRFPSNTVFARTIYVELEKGNPKSRRRLETQILHNTGEDWRAYSYHWTKDQKDAVLYEGEGKEESHQIKDPTTGRNSSWTWRYSNRTECMVCHLTRTGTIHSFTPFQLDREITQAGKKRNQLELLKQLGLFEHPSPKYQRMASLTDEAASVNDRARAYLHVNCSHCHRFGGSGASTIDFRWEMSNDKTLALDAVPTHGTFGLDNPHVITPGRPQESVLLYRFAKLGRGHMPYLGAQEVDVTALKLLERWIREMKPVEPASRVVTQSDTPSQTLAALCSLERAPAKWSAQERDELIQHGLASSRPEIRDLFERFIPRDQRAQTLGTNIRPKDILSLKGDASRGRNLFMNGSGLQCTQCHQVNGTGRSFGPDLSTIGRKYDRAKILENILEPSKLIDPAFKSYSIETKDDLVYNGFLLSRTPSEIQLKDANAQTIKLAAKEVTKVQEEKLSAMPELLLQSLTAQEAADLVEFLSSLK